MAAEAARAIDTEPAGAGDPSAAYARFAAGLAHDDIPAAVRRRALHHVLDAVGIAFAASREDFGRRAFRGLGAVAGDGSVPVLGFPARWSGRDAATINGLLCHGLDFDDTHLRGVIHPTVAQFPAAMSAAIMAGADTTALVTAYVIGVEVATRIASVARGGFHRVGFHPTGICNAPAASLASGRLLGLDESALRHAQGIAMSMSSGTLEFLEDGAWTKRLHPGWAASSGIVAVSMAAAGYVGPGAAYSGRFGLYRAFLGGDDSGCDHDLALAGLGDEWEMLQTAIKPYPACHLSHGCIDAAAALAREDGPDIAGIASVTALVAPQMIPTICEPIAAKRRPRTDYEAQFSIPYLVATALRRGGVTLADLKPEALQDPLTLALAARVGYAPDPDSGYPRHYSGEVRITMADGRTFARRCQVNSGAPEMPVSEEAILAKFEANAGLSLPRERVERLRDLILDLDHPDRPAGDWADDLAALTRDEG
jgi:2-methylcitrate dehydratase PrpD